MSKVIINGAKGRMGQAASAAIEAEPGLSLVGQAGRADHLSKLIASTQADIVVDLTVADAAYTNTRTIIEAGVHPVIGTSGLTAPQIEELSALCANKKLGGIIAPNFSIGAILLMKFSEIAAHHFPNAEIVERHHENKQDAPSGTARKTAQLISAVRKNQALPSDSFAQNAIARGDRIGSIPVHSLRLPASVSHQTVLFSGHEEMLTLHHDSLGRQSFMPGIILACQQVTQLEGLIYGLENIALNLPIVI